MRLKATFPFLLIINILFLYTSSVWAIGDISVSSSQTTTSYSEETDSQSAELSGSGKAIGYRSLETLGFFDLSLEWGTYAVEGSTALHEVKLSTDYVGLMAGLSFRFVPTWLEYSLDLGYRLSVNRMELDRTTSTGKVNNHKIGLLDQQPFSRLGIQIFLGNALFVGLYQEQQSNLFKKTEQGLTPTLKTATSTHLAVGYRLGGSALGVTQTNTQSGPTNYNNPCRLFSACE